MSSSNCCFLTCIQISQEAGQVVWYSHLFQNFPQRIVIHTVKGFSTVNKAEVAVFLELSCFFDVPTDVPMLYRKISIFALLTMPKPSILWFTTNCWKFFKRWEYQTTLPASREIHMQVKRQQLELDIGKQTGSKSGKKYVKAVYCHPAYLTSMQSTSCEMQGWMKHKLGSRLSEEISITSDMQMTPPLWQKAKKN